MRVVVMGGAGRTGRLIVEQALGHGHDVRALVHQAPLSLHHPRLEIVTGDVLQEDDVVAAVESVDAVAFAVGSDGGREVHVYSDGISNVLYAMALHQVTPLVAISAAGVFARKDKRLPGGFKVQIATTLRGVYDDLERMEQRIAASALEWTIIRPVGLTEGEFTGKYRFTLDGSLLGGGDRVAREDVAALALKALETGAYVRRTLAIAGPGSARGVQAR